MLMLLTVGVRNFLKVNQSSMVSTTNACEVGAKPICCWMTCLQYMCTHIYWWQRVPSIAHNVRGRRGTYELLPKVLVMINTRISPHKLSNEDDNE